MTASGGIQLAGRGREISHAFTGRKDPHIEYSRPLAQDLLERTPPRTPGNGAIACGQRQNDLFAYLDTLGVKHSTIYHPPLFSMEDGRFWREQIPGEACKNLFLKDRKDRLWLAVMPGDKRADLRRLEKRVQAARLSFGAPDLLWDVMGVTPGSVTPFGLINDAARRVTVVIDNDLPISQWVNFHPLHNAASTTLRLADLLKFVRSLGYEPVIEDCGP